MGCEPILHDLEGFQTRPVGRLAFQELDLRVLLEHFLHALAALSANINLPLRDLPDNLIVSRRPKTWLAKRLPAIIQTAITLGL
jgi:hypothetical protein